MSAAAVGIVAVVLVATVLDLWLVFTWTRARRDAAALLAEAKRECLRTRQDIDSLASWQAANAITAEMRATVGLPEAITVTGPVTGPKVCSHCAGSGVGFSGLFPCYHCHGGRS